MSVHKVLIVEDEIPLAQTLQAYFIKEDFDVMHIADGAEVIKAFNQWMPDIVLLDLMLPNKDGIQLCKEIREISHIPIMMLTARVDEVDRLLGLETGADDYVCKPFSPREVISRVKAIFRRIHIYHNIAPHNAQHSPLSIDEALMDALWNGQALGLTTIEFRLLNTMSKEPRRVFTRDQLMNNIYNDQRVVNDRTIDSHVTKLRRKLNALYDGDEIVRSVYGAGYKFEQPL